MLASMLNQQLMPIYQQRLDMEVGGDPLEIQSERSTFEMFLGVGILLFRNIRDRHLAWYADVRAERVPYTMETALGFAEEYQQWNEATEYWLARAAEVEQRGIPLEHLAEMRGYHEELKLVELDVRTLARRWEELEQGKGVDSEEFFASLRERRSA